MARVRIPKVGEVWSGREHDVTVVEFNDPFVIYEYGGRLYRQCLAVFDAGHEPPGEEVALKEAA